MKKFTFDVMVGDRYYGSVTMEYNPLWPIEDTEMRKAALTKFPTLRNIPFRFAW